MPNHISILELTPKRNWNDPLIFACSTQFIFLLAFSNGIADIQIPYLVIGILSVSISIAWHRSRELSHSLDIAKKVMLIIWAFADFSYAEKQYITNNILLINIYNYIIHLTINNLDINDEDYQILSYYINALKCYSIANYVAY